MCDHGGLRGASQELVLVDVYPIACLEDVRRHGSFRVPRLTETTTAFTMNHKSASQLLSRCSGRRWCKNGAMVATVPPLSTTWRGADGRHGRASVHLRSLSSNSSSPRNTAVITMPPQSWTEVLYQASRAAYALLTDTTARREFDRYIEQGVIHETVLQSLPGGTLRTFLLFASLYHNSLWREPRPKQAAAAAQPTSAADSYQAMATSNEAPLVDFGHWVRGVGPALENFHNTVALLRNELARQRIQQHFNDSSSNISSNDTEEWVRKVATFLKNKNGQGSSSSMEVQLFGPNTWRQQLESDQNSMVHILSRMTNPTCFHTLYYTSLMDILQALPTSTSKPDFVDYTFYQPHSARVHHVALLQARAVPVYPPLAGNDELAASEDLSSEQLQQRAENADPAVAAQIEVLYETTHIYERTRIPSPHSTMNAQDTSSEASTNTPLSATDTNSESIATVADFGTATTATTDRVVERIQYTNLAVAVFEGWLTRGNYDNYHDDATTHDEEELEWKIALIRQADEFSHAAPTITVLPAEKDATPVSNESKPSAPP
jgi:hypothetical protein